MNLPEFPRFQTVDLSHKKRIDDFLAGAPLEASEYSFTNIFAFRKAYDFTVSLLNGSLIVLRNSEALSAFCPVGNTSIPEVLHDLFNYLSLHSDSPCLERVPESFVRSYILSHGDFQVLEERDMFDYVYSVSELVQLQGRKFHDKKNQVNRFRNNYSYEYLQLHGGLIDDCLAFEDYWCEMKDCDKSPGLRKEKCAILEMLRHFEALGIRGGAIRLEGKIAAIALGEKFLPDTFVIHVEKANPRIPGLYQIINQEFLMHEAGDCLFVNREQDLGVEGLRHAKLSYNPVRFVKKFSVRKNRGGGGQ